MSDFLSKFRNIVLGATMADLPAMMTASGWRLNEKGDYVLDQQNDPHVELLRDNLAAEGAGVMFGEFGIPAIHGLYNLGVRGLGKAGNNWARAKLISRSINDVVDDGLQYFGKVKYYGPTMGKTTAAKTNLDLADFDNVTREAKNNLAKELNIPTRVLQSDPKYALAYLEMLEKLLDSWRRNPLNTNKTLVISKKGLADKNIYNNEPSIPDRQTFVQRLRNRGETDDANSDDWYNMLLKLNPNLKIDNRFVSEIEYNPHYIGFQPTNQSKINYFKDKYGREVTPTPYPGPDSELIDAVTDALLAVLRDYFSPDKINQIKKTMNWGDLEISELQDEILRTIGSRSEVQIKGPKDGFTIIGEHKGKLHGTGADAEASHVVTLNRERIPDLLTAQEAGIHELGVHGKTASMQAEDFGKGGYSDNVRTMFPKLAEITLKNKEIADALLVLNKRGLFFDQFKNVGDLEKYFVNKGLSWKDKWEKFYNAFKYYKYTTKADEKTARAYTGQLFNKVFDPSKKTLNIELLERYYTPGSVEAFKKAVLGVAPFATAASLVPSDKKGSKLRKRATFVLNARGWAKKHLDGGETYTKEQEAVKRALASKAPASNYSQAVDMDIWKPREVVTDWVLRLGNFFGVHARTGLSNCTLTASQWANPDRPIGRAASIVTNPGKHLFSQIPEEYAIPGTLVIASKDPALYKDGVDNVYHTMLLTGFADKDYDFSYGGKDYKIKKGEPLVDYSRGKNMASELRRKIPLSVYNDQGEGKTFNRFYKPQDDKIAQAFLPEITVRPK